MSEETLRRDLRAAFANRAMLYWSIYRSLAAALGSDQAEALLSAGIRARGAEVSGVLAAHAPGDMPGLRDAFLGTIADQGRMFQPEVVRCDAGHLDIDFHRCPLKETWVEAGLPPDTVARLCRIAGKIDNGMFETAGFTFTSETWAPGRDGCCRLRVRPGSPATP
ncbi:L-2-amino-thiazoline-4-carboxylic acid hydrolase [Desertibaculum subflavum]|uniref:L-2-amino-thiazoline-4-carboxylic acid hydrolase n=1 Tax=Desertibaculum subflavum TaxID=2268458 RepID=UPI000E66C99D